MPQFIYLDYDGNRGTVTPNERMNLYQGRTCRHHPPEETGDLLFDVRKFVRRRAIPPRKEAKNGGSNLFHKIRAGRIFGKASSRRERG